MTRLAPDDAERFGVGLEDDGRLQRAKLIAGVLSELALIGMLITSLQEPGRDATVLLAVVVAALGVTMGVHVARYRADGQPRTHSSTTRVEPPPRENEKRDSCVEQARNHHQS
jgi:hypothetical protein